MSETFDEFQEKFRVAELKVLESEYWTWSVRPVHSTLGAGILSLNRFCDSLGRISDDEGADLARVAKTIEAALADVTRPDKMNYIMLMMVDKHLHFHILPRYAETKTFASLEWVDSGWPKPPTLNDYEDRASSPVLLEIRDALRKSFSSK